MGFIKFKMIIQKWCKKLRMDLIEMYFNLNWYKSRFGCESKYMQENFLISLFVVFLEFFFVFVVVVWNKVIITPWVLFILIFFFFVFSIYLDTQKFLTILSQYSLYWKYTKENENLYKNRFSLRKRTERKMNGKNGIVDSEDCLNLYGRKNRIVLTAKKRKTKRRGIYVIEEKCTAKSRIQIGAYRIIRQCNRVHFHWSCDVNEFVQVLFWKRFGG